MITLDCQRSNAETTIRVNNVYGVGERTLSKTAIVPPGHLHYDLCLCTPDWCASCHDDWPVDAIKDYETEIIKISALLAVRPSCGQSVVLATNIITGLARL